MTDMDKMMIDGVMVAFDIYLRRLHYERRLSQKRVDEDRELFRAVVAQYVTACNPDDRLRDALELLVHAAQGLSFGADWNKGTSAKLFRQKLLDAIPIAREALSPLPQGDG